MSSQIEAILGRDWKFDLARVLACTPQRFDHPIQPRVWAIIELRKCLLLHPSAQMPAIWNGGSRDTTDVAPNVLRKRYSNLFGARCLAPRLSHALELAQGTVAGAFEGRSSRAEFDLLTIVEMLEALSDAGADLKDFPERWRAINSAEELQRSTRRAPPIRECPDHREMKDRVSKALGGQNASARFARALEKSPDALSRLWRCEVDSNGRPARVQPYLVAIVELLETLQAEGVPPERWPERWRAECREPDATLERDREDGPPVPSSGGAM
ncbi:MAG: hypothetical protein JSR99_08260 [Proteobacteria bacterium]|nr:hypothetical protein [Pseudomonadota bacterium]